MIQPGAAMPSVPVKLITAKGVEDTDAASAFAQGKSVLFTVPGAFTPTCHNNHLPGFVELADEIKAHGVSRIVCATVNDHHVTKAWADASGALGKIDFLADGNAALAKSLGLDKDMSGGGMGTRFIRAAILIDNGKVEDVYAEDAPGQVTSSGATAILAVLAGK